MKCPPGVKIFCEDLEVRFSEICGKLDRNPSIQLCRKRKRERSPTVHHGSHCRRGREAANEQKRFAKLILELGRTTEAHGDLVGAGLLTCCIHTSQVWVALTPFSAAPN